MSKKSYTARREAGLCTACGTPVGESYVLCAKHRQISLDYQSQRNFDRWVDREFLIRRRYLCMNTNEAAELLGLSRVRIAGLIFEGKLNVMFRELRRVWIPNIDVKREIDRRACLAAPASAV